MEDLINRSVGASVAIERQLEANLPPAMADANQIELAILNLCINARDAMPSGGTLTIATRHHPELYFVSIRVSDIGIGMPPDVAARAFDPFYSTKPPGKGTGLGLSQVYGIAKQSGGDISLQSEVGSGTTVTLYLPRSETMVKPEEVPSHVSARAHDSERLLIVDDDHDVREIMAAFMSELGYQVRDAEHGQAALQALSDFCPDAVILDFAMPGMNGAEAAVAIRERCPNVPLLFVSGFADSELLEKSVGKAPLLRKPFRPAELATAVRSVLENAHRPGA
jgi:CheY-like chemotaxis protein